MSTSQDILTRVIVNGKNADDPALRESLMWAQQQGRPMEVRVTQNEGDAARFAAEESDSPCDVVVAVGGDGTVNEVLNGILHARTRTEPALAIVPLGTANDFARSCAIPQDHPTQALRLAWEGVPQWIDVGRANDRFFLNVATAGFGAEVAAGTPSVAKKVLGSVAYVVTGLLRAATITPYPSQLVLPEERWEGNLVVITVANGRQAGGGIPVAPKAALDDGLLDVMVIHDAGILQSGKILSEFRDVEAEDNEYVFYRQAPSLRLELAETVRLDVDGEPIYAHAFDFRILQRRLRIMLPPETPLSWQ